MSHELDPKVGRWYRRLDDEQLFKVVAIDEDDGLVEIRKTDGEIEELDSSEWIELDLEVAEPPEDYVDPDAASDEDEEEEDDVDVDDDDDDDDVRRYLASAKQRVAFMRRLYQAKCNRGYLVHPLFQVRHNSSHSQDKRRSRRWFLLL